MDKQKHVDKSSNARKPAEKPVSLHPLKFEEAVADLLKVKLPKKEKQSGKSRRTKSHENSRQL